MKRHPRMKWLRVVVAVSVSALMAASPARAADEAFDVGTLHVERSGERGPAVILIPGMASGAWVWQGTVDALKADRRVYAVTLPGFDGRPALPADNKESLLISANDSIAELIAAQKLERPVLVGHSLGGTLAILFAQSRSDRIAGVVALDGLPVFPGTEGVPLAERPRLAEQVRTQMVVDSPEAFAAQQLQYMQRVGVTSPDQAAALAKRTVRSDPEALANYAAELATLDLRAGLSGIAVPVLEIVPYQPEDSAPRNISESMKTGYYRGLLKGVPKLDVQAIAPSRHFAMVDQPEAFIKALRGFLKKVEKVN